MLNSEPKPVESLEELFAIAHAMEHEAATRYSEIARRLRDEGNPSLAEIFERLSNEERGHLDAVARWAEKTRGKPPDPTLVRWELPETFDDEGAGAVDPRLLTAYRSLSTAVRNEERAFAFWSYVAAHAADPEIRQAAETMAREELDHVATLRRERRRAFHAERSKASVRTDAGAVMPVALERRLAAELDGLAAQRPADAARLRDFASEARRTAADIERAPIPFPADVSGRQGQIPDEAAVLSERLVDIYLDAADRIGDEAALTRFQTYAGRAIERLAWLRADREKGSGRA